MFWPEALCLFTALCRWSLRGLQNLRNTKTTGEDLKILLCFQPEVSFCCFGHVFFCNLLSTGRRFLSARVTSLVPQEVTECLQLHTYIKTMGLAALWTHRSTQELNPGPHPSQSYSGETRHLMKIHTERTCYLFRTPTTIQMCSRVFWPVVLLIDVLQVKHQFFLIQQLPSANRKGVFLLQLAQQWVSSHMPLTLPFPPHLICLLYTFSLIVCNSYQVSLRPTSVASNSFVGKPSVCCQRFIGIQGGGLLLFSVILACQ